MRKGFNYLRHVSLEELLLICSYIFTPQPSELEGYCRHDPGGRVDGRLQDLRNPYLCNHVTDFLRSKFCGIV